MKKFLGLMLLLIGLGAAGVNVHSQPGLAIGLALAISGLFLTWSAER